MESQQMAPHRHHAHHHEPHNVALHPSVEGEEDGQHHEKKSVLKNVKAKAKKIKDAITKHGHAHDHHDYEDDDEGEGVVADPELQGAPLFEGAAMRSAVDGQGQHQDIGIGLSTAMHNQPPPASSRPSAGETGFTSINKPTTKLDNSAVEPNTTMSLSPWRLEEDKTHPHTPHNSEVKVLDLTKRGNEKAGDSQTFDSFAKMKVNDEDEPNPTGLASGIDQEGNQSSYAEKNLPMREKAVASKLGYGEITEENTNTNSNSSSLLEYGKKIALAVTEKLKPGEEDKALSSVISEALNTRKEEGVKFGESQPKGKVTESEELIQRLGGEDNNEGTQRSSAASATTAATVKSVADMLRDSVGSWLGKKGGDQTPPSQQSPGTSEGVEGFMDSSAAGEGRQRQEPSGTVAEVRIVK